MQQEKKTYLLDELKALALEVLQGNRLSEARCLIAR